MDTPVITWDILLNHQRINSRISKHFPTIEQLKDIKVMNYYTVGYILFQH